MEQDYVSIQETNAGAGLGALIGIFAICFGVFNLAFIIPNLIYAYQGTQCVTYLPNDGISFTLGTWLQVDAYTRIGIVALLLLVAFISCVSLQLGASLLVCSVCVILIYSLFQVAWLIVGSVLFWGQLNPLGICTGPVQSYVFALLIISYVSIFCNCLFGLKSQNQNQIM